MKITVIFSILFLLISDKGLARVLTEADISRKNNDFMDCIKANYCWNDTKIQLDLKASASHAEKKLGVFEWLNYSCNRELIKEGFQIEYSHMRGGGDYTFWYWFKHPESNVRIETALGCSPSKDFNSMIECNATGARNTSMDTLLSAMEDIQKFNDPYEAFYCKANKPKKTHGVIVYDYGQIGFRKNPTTGECDRICPENTIFFAKSKAEYERYQMSFTPGAYVDKYTGEYVASLKFKDVTEFECVSCNDPTYFKSSNYVYTSSHTNSCYDVDACPRGKEKSLKEDVCVPKCLNFSHRNEEGVCEDSDKEACERYRDLYRRVQGWNYNQDLSQVRTPECTTSDFINAARSYVRENLTKLEKSIRRFCNHEDQEDRTYLHIVPFGSWVNYQQNSGQLSCHTPGLLLPFAINGMPELGYDIEYRSHEMYSFEYDPEQSGYGRGYNNDGGGIGSPPPR